MNITQEEKLALVSKFGNDPKDTGNTKVQIAIFTERINRLTDHLKTHKKDHSTRLGLLKLVGKRRNLLDYLMKHNLEGYRELIKALNIRK
jgi:small subunit ribosomal protein S15